MYRSASQDLALMGSLPSPKANDPQRLLKTLNTPLGLPVIGAIISGLLVPYVTDQWQRQSWIFQQEFTLEKSKFDQQLDQKYKILDEVNQALADILTYSESVTVMKQKGASTA
jgi:hypothetical protein